MVGERKPGAMLNVIMTRKNGEQVTIPVKCRVDTAEELSIYEAGGVLQRFAQDFLANETKWLFYFVPYLTGSL